MNRNCILTLCAFLFGTFIFTQTVAQKENHQKGFEKLTPLSQKDSLWLVNLPKLTLADSYKNTPPPQLPTIVDNSQQIYWRPVFAQIQYECGQASGVGLGFTYAMNRARNLPSNVEENQYPTHFCFNWANDGNGYHGVSYFHSFEVIRTLGIPNVETYGGMTATPEHWMTGYENYYEAMHNRIWQVYQIDVSTAEGIETAKHWIHNHLENADVGGVANFYTQAPSGMPTLPAGTPEEGKYVVTSWGGANHGLTICMYHDSICWDYNNDGQYTNDIDLNGDGIITPRDWEIGGFRFANTYSGGPAFGNDGFCYMTYKSCADPSENGGIWNNAIHVLYVKESTEPLLTAKITIKYDCREEIRVRMGISTDTTSLTPEYILGFPVFDYQGGCHYMQGDTTEEAKTIEFGLDITPFLNMIESGTPVRYFLLVDERDPNNWYTGEIVNFSIMDYTSGLTEIECEETNVWINQGSLTKLWVNHTVNFNDVVVESDSLQPATVYEPYNASLEASGGTTDYLWDYDLNFTETNYTETFPMVNAEQLSPGSNYTTKQLDFSFPFYGEEYDEVRVYADGYIMFEDVFDWPYQVYDFFNFTKNKIIAPFMADLNLYSATNDGLWYEGNDISATFRWKASVNGYQNNSVLNFAVQLFNNGDIKYYYGSANEYPHIEWVSGVSAGDNKYYQFTEVSNDPVVPQNFVCDLKASFYPEGFSVSRFGEFSGLPDQVYENFEVKFRVTDESNLTDSKTLLFSTDGSNYLVIDNYSVVSGDNGVIEFGETVYLTVDIESLGEETIYDADMLITINDEFITLTDSIEPLGDFEPGEIKSFTNAFTFNVNNSVPNDYGIDFNTQINDDNGESWLSHIYLTAFAPEIYASNIIVDDGENGGLDPGETADLIITLTNDGGATANNIVATLLSSDPYITINTNTAGLTSINPYSSSNVTYNITVSENVPLGYILEFAVDIEADNDYVSSSLVFVAIGLMNEDFETGNFSVYPWYFIGDTNWLIDNATFYEGNYSAVSGDIEDNQSSSMLLNAYILGGGEISFYKKVSSEANYDYLKFLIDGIEIDSWAGEQDWSIESYQVDAGLHTFTWTYDKDVSVSNGSDCGWIDLITFPPFGDPYPQLSYTPETFVFTIENEIVSDTITITNEGSGPLIYTIETVDSLGNPIEWIIFNSQTGGLNAGESDEIIVDFDATQLEEGNYNANIVISDHLNNEFIISVWMLVDINTGLSENKQVSNTCNIPNPFNHTTNICFELNKPGSLSLEIYDLKGTKIRTLFSGSLFSKGEHNVKWDATNDEGNRVEAGLYLYKLSGGKELHTGKMLLTD